MLNVMLKATGIELTDAITAAVEKKLGALDKYLERFGTPKEARVEVGKISAHHKKGEVYRVEVNLRLPGTVLRAESSSFKLYDAIDLVKDELKREIAKRVGTKESEKLRGARAAKEMGTESDLAH